MQLDHELDRVRDEICRLQTVKAKHRQNKKNTKKTIAVKVKKLKELEEIKLANRIASFKFKTDRTLAILEDLTSRQMVMKIFDYLDNPALYQILNRRFYDGIAPNWFSRIQIAMSIRLTEVADFVSSPEYIDWEFPSSDYIKGLTTAQKRTLRISGVS